jgi:hypothetical protein
MSKTFHQGERRNGQRHIRVRGIRRDVPDYRKLARAVIALAQAQAESEAEAGARVVEEPPSRKPKSNSLRHDDKPNDQEGDAA